MSPLAGIIFVTLALFAVGVLLYRPRWTVYLALIFVSAALPTAVPQSFTLPLLGTVFTYEILLLLALIWALFSRDRLLAKRSPGAFWVYAGIVLYGVALGFYRGTDHHHLLDDARGLADGVVAAVVAYKAMAVPEIRRHAVRIIRWVMWLSLASTVGASLGLWSLAGRTQQLVLGDASSTAARLLSPAQFAVVAVVCIALSLWLSGEIRVRTALGYIAPGAVVMVLSFSRNNLIALAAVLVYTLLARGRARHIAGATYRIAALVAVLFAVVVVAPLLPGSYVQEQVSAFDTRVLGGISPAAVASDRSAQFRIVDENDIVLPFIYRKPITGYGFGADYKPSYGPEGSFTATEAPYYVHEFYYWLWFKTGLIGIGMFAWVVGAGLLRATFRTRTALSTAVAGTLLGLLGVDIVAPIAHGNWSGALFGAIIGILYWLNRRDLGSDHARAGRPARGPGAPYVVPRQVGSTASVPTERPSPIGSG